MTFRKVMTVNEPMSRRGFLALAGATAGALLLGNPAQADSDGKETPSMPTYNAWYEKHMLSEKGEAFAHDQVPIEGPISEAETAELVKIIEDHFKQENETVANIRLVLDDPERAPTRKRMFQTPDVTDAAFNQYVRVLNPSLQKFYAATNTTAPPILDFRRMTEQTILESISERNVPVHVARHAAHDLYAYVQFEQEGETKQCGLLLRKELITYATIEEPTDASQRFAILPLYDDPFVNFRTVHLLAMNEALLPSVEKHALAEFNAEWENHDKDADAEALYKEKLNTWAQRGSHLSLTGFHHFYTEGSAHGFSKVDLARHMHGKCHIDKKIERMGLANVFDMFRTTPKRLYNAPKLY